MFQTTYNTWQRTLIGKVIATFVLVLAASASSWAGVTNVPLGWTLHYSTLPNQFTGIRGIEVYKKRNAYGAWEYVTAIDMRYSRLRSFTGEVSGPQYLSRVVRLSQDEYLRRARLQDTSSRKTAVIINGTFFAPNDNPTGISFGLMSDWWHMSSGYEIGTRFRDQEMLLLFDTSYGSSSIPKYDIRHFSAGVPNAIGGLTTTADKNRYGVIPRTFVGVLDQNRDSKSETVIFFSSPSATQAHAASILGGFGAGSRMMLDGGGSTFLTVNGTKVISSPENRHVPQAFVLYTTR